MTIKQRIDKFVKKYPEPYQFKIELRWSRKDGIHTRLYFPHNDSGSKHWRDNCFATRTGRDFIAQHYRYDEKLELLEISYAIFDCHVPKKGEKRRWKYADRYFVPKDTRDLYDINGEQRRYHFIRASYDQYAYNKCGFINHFAKMPFYKNMWIDEFMRFAGDNLQTTCSWRTHITNESHPWELECWFRYVPKQKTTGKMQKLIDDLSAKELELSDSLRERIKSKMEEDRYTKKYAWFDLDHKVFRCFVESADGIFEDKRVYIAGKSKYAVATINPQGEWVTNGSFTMRRFDFQIINIDDVFKLPYCDYLRVLIGVNKANVYRVVSAMKNPEIEQLSNMGLPNLAKYLYGQDGIKSSMKNLFGQPNKKKNVLAKYGINKKQAEYIDSKISENNNRTYYYYYNRISGISDIKEYMHIDNISSLDHDTFVKYYKFVSDLDWSSRRRIEEIPTDVRQKVVNKLCNMYEKHNNVLTLFSDTMSVYNDISRANRPDVDIYSVKSYEELARMHNMLIELQEME